MHLLTKSLTNRTVCLIFLFSLFTSNVWSQNKKTNAGLAIGFIPASDASIYLGRDINGWVDREPSLIYEINASYRISEYFKAGAYFENEKAKLKLLNSEEVNINRWALGLQWLGNYPDYFVQWQLGGYTGLGTAHYSAGNAGFFGLDYGIITGPAFEKENYGLALHIHAGFTTYSGSDLPDEFSMHDIRLFFKINYKF